MKRAIVLIDGQNLYYGFKNLGILEYQIKWDVFLKALTEPTDELIRTYWFRPQKILDSYYTTANIKSQIVFKKFPQHHYDFINNTGKIPPLVMAQIDNEVTIVEGWLKKEKAKFSRIEFNYDQISLGFGDIEFIKTGIVKVNPFTQEYVGEKGVDIALAVKMIALCVNGNCDKIILVSGDYDYAEAIKFVKDKMMKIHLVKFHKGHPPKNRSVSRDLAVLADKVIDVYESELKSIYWK